MLDCMTPEQFRERYAHWIVEPWGDEWRQTATVASAAHDAVGTYMAAKSQQRIKPFNLYNLIPIPEWLRKLRTPRYVMTDEESEANLQ